MRGHGATHATFHHEEPRGPEATVVEGLLHGGLVKVTPTLIDILPVLQVLPEAVNVFCQCCSKPGVLHTLGLQVCGDVHWSCDTIWEDRRLVRVVAMAGSRVVQGIIATIVYQLQVSFSFLHK